jgi:hypothetical protein
MHQRVWVRVDSRLLALGATPPNAAEPGSRETTNKPESTTQRNTYAHVELPYKTLDVLCLVKVPEYFLGKPVLIQNWSNVESALEASRWKRR